MPHYVASPPNPIATRGLLDRLAELVGIGLDLSDLDRLAASWRERVDEVIAGDDDVTNYVRQLEKRYDENVAAEADVPSGETLAAELERFLREQRGDH